MEHDRSDELHSQGWPRGFAGSFRVSDTPHGSGDNAWFSLYAPFPFFRNQRFPPRTSGTSRTDESYGENAVDLLGLFLHWFQVIGASDPNFRWRHVPFAPFRVSISIRSVRCA